MENCTAMPAFGGFYLITIGLSSSTWMKLVTEFSPQCIFSLIYREKSEQKEQNGFAKHNHLSVRRGSLLFAPRV
jgi:hypothetical protein